MIGQSGNHCSENTHLSSTKLLTRRHLLRLALYQFFHLPRHYNCQWRYLHLLRRTRPRHLMRPIWFTVASATTLLARTDLHQHLRHYHSCLSATLPMRSRRRGAVTTTQLSRPRSVSPVERKTTHPRVIPLKLATTQDSRCPAFLSRRALHKPEVFLCQCHRLITSLRLMCLPGQWAWYSRQRPDNHTRKVARRLDRLHSQHLR